jgi:hypothetical protein
MTQEDIIRMAREAGFQSAEYWPDDFKGLMGCVERFAALVRAAEREACCGGDVLNSANISGDDSPHQVIEKYRAAIRARGQA